MYIYKKSYGGDTPAPPATIHTIHTIHATIHTVHTTHTIHTIHGINKRLVKSLCMSLNTVKL